MCLFTQAQKAAHTAGSESLTNQNTTEQSITKSQTATIPSGNYTKASDTEVVKSGQNSTTPPAKNSTLSTVMLLIAGLLAGIAYYFLRTKSKANLPDNNLNIESEEKDKLKKEMWEKISKPSKKDN